MSYQDVQDQWKTHYPLRRYKVTVIMFLPKNIYYLLFHLLDSNKGNWVNDLIKECWELIVSPQDCVKNLVYNNETEELEKERFLRELPVISSNQNVTI